MRREGRYCTKRNYADALGLGDTQCFEELVASRCGWRADNERGDAR